MDDNLISVIDVASCHGALKQTVFKILKRLRIEPVKQRNSSNRNQLISYITQDEFKRVSSELLSITTENVSEQKENEILDEKISAEQGVFYLGQLKADHDPGRFKVGFAANMAERLRALRCSAPFATPIKTWACRRLWERTAIDCVTADCERLHTEVFRADSMEKVIDKCEKFFEMMPALGKN